MIKIKNLNKFYNKNKTNQIHVINDISLEFEDTGLVCLLGQSGSGKTTLLNAIGGLDKVESGSIQYENDVLSKYKSDDWDYIRNKHVGYIFQNYNLLLNLSVYDNVIFTLKMTNLSEEEAHDRVMYSLKSVGIEKYYKRRVTQLSGGQQQRVAIARALAKSPNVIIADELTGNLDEKNTTMIMNILKHISKKTLVILVTHEERIAKFYASRIIRLTDGKVISDETNNNNESYVFNDDNNIYLKDLNSEDLNSENININYFYEKEKPKLEFNVIYKNDTFFIEPLNNKIKVIDSKDEIKVINDTKPKIGKVQVEEFTYDLDKIEDLHYKKKSNIKLKDCFRMALKRVSEMRRFQKLVFLGFLLSAFLFLFSMSSLYSSLNIEDSDFMTSGCNEYAFTIKNADILEVANKIVEEDLGIMYLERKFTLDYDKFEQGNNGNLHIDTWSNSLNLKSTIRNKDIILGDIGGYNSILIDKIIIDSLLENKRFTDLGFNSYDDFIGMTINNEKMIISGIVDKNTPEIYLEKEYFVNYMITLDDTSYLTGISSELNNNEIYINNKNFEINSEIVIFDKDYTIKGYSDKELLFSEKEYFSNYYKYINSITKSTLRIDFYSYNNDTTNKFIIENDSLFYYYINIYERDYNYYIEEVIYSLIILFAFSIILITTSIVFLYFIMRSSLISRVYDIGVYRSLGITKKDIRKIFTAEILLISLLSSFIGWIVSYIFIINFGNLLGLSLPLIIAVITLLLIGLLNIIIGLIPINNLLKLTPSEIGSKYDI